MQFVCNSYIIQICQQNILFVQVKLRRASFPYVREPVKKNYLLIVDYLLMQVWDLFYESDKVREMLSRLIKEESLRTYLFTYSNVYASVSVKTLSEMFEMKQSVVHSIISKMIINEELMVRIIFICLRACIFSIIRFRLVQSTFYLTFVFLFTAMFSK